MSPCTCGGLTGVPSFSISDMNSCCIEGVFSSRAAGLNRDDKKVRSCFTRMRSIASFPKSRPSFAIASLLEKSHQTPAPINPSRMTKTTRICPDDFDGEYIFNLSILESESKAFNHFTVPNQCAVVLLAGVSAEAISSIDCEIDQVTVKMFVFRSQIGRFRIAVPFNPRAPRIDQLCFEPFVHDFFVVRRVRPAQRRIRWRILCHHVRGGAH